MIRSTRKNRSSRRIFISLIFIFLMLSAAVFLTLYERVTDISYSTDLSMLPDDDIPPGDSLTVYFGVISRFSPHLIYRGYQPIMDYLSSMTPYRFELKLSSSYDQTVRQINRGQVSIAFLGSFIYARDREKFDLKCILKPLNSDRQPYFHSVLISADSSVRTLSDLKGKKLALPSAESFSANWLSMIEMPKHGLTQADLGEITFFSFHHNVAEQILMGYYDAGVVKDRVAFEYLDRGIRIVHSSMPIPGSPIVASRYVDPSLLETVTRVLLALDPSDPADSMIMADWDGEFRQGFVPAEETDYDILDSLIFTSGVSDD